MTGGDEVGFKEKLNQAMTAKLIGYLVLLPALMVWIGWTYGGEVKARAWTLPLENAEAIRKMIESEEIHEDQYAQIQADIAYLKMIWGIAKIQTTGGDQVFALRNTESPALRFRPGQEIWVTNNSDQGSIKIKVKIREGGFVDKNTVLLRLSKKAGEELEAKENQISIGIAIVTEE